MIDDLSSGREEHLRSAARFEQVDIVSGDLDAMFARWRPDVVYHLAAQASVPASQADPLRDLAVNVVGTHRVGVASNGAGAGRLVFVSSGGAVYGSRTTAATERSLPAPTSYYGAHKLAAEAHVALVGLPYAIARPSNVYGPRQVAGLEGAVVAAFLDQAAEGALRIHGDGTQVRDFLHVLDAVEALCVLARPGGSTGIWNVAAGNPITIARLADLVQAAIGRRVPLEYGPTRPGDVHRSSLSAARLRRLGWRPSMTIANGIRQLADSRRLDAEARPPARSASKP